jgi:hypothetical protein
LQSALIAVTFPFAGDAMFSQNRSKNYGRYPPLLVSRAILQATRRIIVAKSQSTQRQDVIAFAFHAGIFCISEINNYGNSFHYLVQVRIPSTFPAKLRIQAKVAFTWNDESVRHILNMQRRS